MLSLTVQWFFLRSTGQLILKSFTPFSETSRRHCGNPRLAAAAPSNATARWPWECRAVASFWQHDKSLNQSTGPTPPHTSKNAPRGAALGEGMPSHRVPEVMVWKCTMSLSVFCYVPVRWREKTGEARELMKWLHSGREGEGGLVLNSWQKPSLFNTVLQCPVESGVKSDEEQRDALHPSLVLLRVFHKITQFHRTALHATSGFSTHHLMGQQPTIRTLFKILTRLSMMC